MGITQSPWITLGPDAKLDRDVLTSHIHETRNAQMSRSYKRRIVADLFLLLGFMFRAVCLIVSGFRGVWYIVAGIVLFIVVAPYGAGVILGLRLGFKPPGAVELGRLFSLISTATLLIILWELLR